MYFNSYSLRPYRSNINSKQKRPTLDSLLPYTSYNMFCKNNYKKILDTIICCTV